MAAAKNPESEALMKLGKVTLPKEVAPKAPGMGNIANVGTAGTL